MELSPIHLLRVANVLQVGQLHGSMVLALLDMVPNELIGYPGGLLFDQLGVLKVRTIADGKALAAIAAHDRLRRSSAGGRFGRRPQTCCDARLHQRGSRRC